MSSNLPAPTIPGLAPDMEHADIVERFAAAIETERGYDALPKMPTVDERRALTARRDALMTKLRPFEMATAEQDRFAQAFGLMVLGYPSMRNQEIRPITTAYALDLGKLPLFAVLAAMEDVRQRRVKGLDPDWPPTSPRLFEIAQKHVEKDAAALLKVQRVMAVRKAHLPPDPAMKERVGELWITFAEALKHKLKTQQNASWEKYAEKYKTGESEDRMRLEQYRAEGFEPVYRSDGTLMTLSLVRTVSPERLKKTPRPNEPGDPGWSPERVPG